jgi:hypothetical protein
VLTGKVVSTTVVMGRVDAAGCVGSSHVPSGLQIRRFGSQSLNQDPGNICHSVKFPRYPFSATKRACLLNKEIKLGPNSSMVERNQTFDNNMWLREFMI